MRIVSVEILCLTRDFFVVSGPGPGAGRGGGLRRTGTGQAGRQPRTITLKDVIALLEREPRMSKSPLLYRLYERERKLEVSRRM